jgi:DNA-binding NarL/FixJ family response regulator
MDRAVRILVMDDAPVVRRLIVSLLDDIDGVESVLQATDAPSAVTLMEQHNPQIAILDVKVPGGAGLRNGIDVLKAVKSTHPDSAIIMLTNHATPKYKSECEQAGAAYFFDKSSEFDKLPIVVEELVHGLLEQ